MGAIVVRSPDLNRHRARWNGTMSQLLSQKWGASHDKVVRDRQNNMVHGTMFDLLIRAPRPQAVEGAVRPPLTSISGGLLYRLLFNLYILSLRKKTALRPPLSPGKKRRSNMVPCTMLFAAVRT